MDEAGPQADYTVSGSWKQGKRSGPAPPPATSAVPPDRSSALSPRGELGSTNRLATSPARPSRTRGARRSQAEAHPRRRPERAYRGGMNCIRSPKARQSKTSSISAARDGLCARQFRDDAMVLRRGVHPYADAVLRDLTSSISAAVVPVPWRYETSAVLARDQNSGECATCSLSWVVGQFE
jgi:hypothetical protein